MTIEQIKIGFDNYSYVIFCPIKKESAIVDPGFEGTLAFELYNAGKTPLPLFAGIRVAQISFYDCSEPTTPYSKKSSAKYSKSTEIIDALFYNDPEYKIIQKYISNKLKELDKTGVKENEISRKPVR